MKLSTAAGAAALLAALLAGAARARDIPAGGLTYEEVAAWLRDSGYPAQVKPDPTTGATADSRIVSSSIDGVNFDIYFYVCSAGRCGSVQYAAGWTSSAGSPDRIGAWNRDKRYIRAYTTSNGQYWAEYDVDIDPGSYEQLAHSLARWREAVDEYKTYMSF
jgi:hypothetical protein